MLQRNEGHRQIFELAGETYEAVSLCAGVVCLRTGSHLCILGTLQQWSVWP